MKNVLIMLVLACSLLFAKESSDGFKTWQVSSGVAFGSYNQIKVDSIVNDHFNAAVGFNAVLGYRWDRSSPLSAWVMFDRGVSDNEQEKYWLFRNNDKDTLAYSEHNSVKAGLKTEYRFSYVGFSLYGGVGFNFLDKKVRIGTMECENVTDFFFGYTSCNSQTEKVYEQEYVESDVKFTALLRPQIEIMPKWPVNLVLYIQLDAYGVMGSGYGLSAQF